MPMIGAHRQLDAVEHRTSAGRSPARCRASPAPGSTSTSSNSFSTSRAIPAAEFLRLDDQRGRHHGAGDQPVAHRRDRNRRRACAGGRDAARAPSVAVMTIGGRARARGFGNLDLALAPQRLGDARRPRRSASGNAPLLEIAAGDRDAQAVDAARRASARVGSTGAVGADRIVGIAALHGVVGEREVARPSARAGPRWSRLATNGKRAGARQPAVGRLQAEQAAERGRHADRAVGVGAERERHQPAGDRAARAARRAAGHARQVVRIARRAVVHVLAGEVVGVLAHVERADQHGAGRLQPRDQRRVARRPAARSRLILEPARVGRPATSNRFLTANGTPASGPSGWPAARAASIAARAWRARARAVTAVKALSAGSRVAMRASAASTTARALALPAVDGVRRSRCGRPVSPSRCPSASGLETGAGSASSGKLATRPTRRGDGLKRDLEIGACTARLPCRGSIGKPERPARRRRCSVVDAASRHSVRRSCHAAVTPADAGSPRAGRACSAPRARTARARSALARRSARPA